MTVLIVEDHRVMAEWLRDELRRAGWTPTVAGTAADAERAVRQSTFDVVLLDIGLPDGSGMDVCRRILQITKSSVIMLTARDSIPDRVQSLDIGADDYLTKPFAVEELLARMRAVIRRTQGDGGPLLERGRVRLWLEERRAECEGQDIPLSRREFDLLAVLMRHPGRVWSRQDLLENAWGYDFYGESNVVDVTIGRLRERLGIASGLTITAMRGIGYVLRQDL
jgi:DNA-binding response OmpR family regulator